MKKVFGYSLFTGMTAFLLFGCSAGSEGACCESPVKSSASIVQKGFIDDNATKKVEKDQPKRVVTKAIEPVAIAHANGQYKIVQVSTCQSVTFDANSSYDPDGNSENLSYIWTNIDKEIVSTSDTFEKIFSKRGLYEMTLTVTDEQNLTGTDRVCILSGISEMCMPLLADAGEDRVVKVGEKVTLNGRGICRDDIVKYTWKEGDKILSTTAKFETILLDARRHTLTLMIEDMEGKTAETTVVITVVK